VEWPASDNRISVSLSAHAASDIPTRVNPTMLRLILRCGAVACTCCKFGRCATRRATPMARVFVKRGSGASADLSRGRESCRGFEQDGRSLFSCSAYSIDRCATCKKISAINQPYRMQERERNHV
jgi:hypothetical protein